MALAYSVKISLMVLVTCLVPAHLQEYAGENLNGIFLNCIPRNWDGDPHKLIGFTILSQRIAAHILDPKGFSLSGVVLCYCLWKERNIALHSGKRVTIFGFINSVKP